VNPASKSPPHPRQPPNRKLWPTFRLFANPPPALAESLTFLTVRVENQTFHTASLSHPLYYTCICLPLPPYPTRRPFHQTRTRRRTHTARSDQPPEISLPLRACPAGQITRVQAGGRYIDLVPTFLTSDSRDLLLSKDTHPTP
jgi:hypothetical protein